MMDSLRFSVFGISLILLGISLSQLGAYSLIPSGLGFLFCLGGFLRGKKSNDKCNLQNIFLEEKPDDENKNE